jgi:hypothetical protein
MVPAMATAAAPDPVNRRTAIAIVAAGTLLGVAGIWALGRLHPDLEAWVREDPVPRLRLMLAVLGALAVGPLLAMAGYLWRAGGKIARHGRLMRLLAGLLGVTAALMGALLWRLGASL